MLPGKTLKLPDILQMARRRIWLITIPAFGMFFLALLYSSRLPNLYQADMLIAIDPQRVPDSLVQSTVTLETDQRMEALQVQVLSRTALQQMIESFDLYPSERRVMPIEDVVALMRGNVRVDLELPRSWARAPTPTAFHIRFTYTDARTAANVTQQLGQLFVEQNLKDRGAQAGATNRFLESQLAEARTKLEVQERRLESFRQLHGQELPTQMQSNMQSLSSVQLQAQSLVESIARDKDRKLMLERLYRDAANDALTAPVATTQTGASGGTPVLTAQDQLAAARATLGSLAIRYKADHPDVARARRQVSELEEKVKQEASAAPVVLATSEEAPAPAPGQVDPTRRENLRQMRAEIESLDRQVAFKDGEERRLRTEISEYQRRLEAVPGLESEWTKLTRDYDTQQTAYRELLTKSTAAEVAVNLEQENIGERFRIVDPAVLPVHPLRSLRLQYNLGGLAIGLLLGVAVSALLEFKDKAFRTDTEIMEVLGLPVLASIPMVTSEARRARGKKMMLGLSLLGAVSLVVAAYVTWLLRLWESLA